MILPHATTSERLAVSKAVDTALLFQVGSPAPAGSVLVHAPSFAFQSPGGGENQLLQTSAHLQALDVDVRFFTPWLDRLVDGRLLHLYGMSREGLELARVAKSQSVPIALSPICWFEPQALWRLAPSRTRGCFDLVKWSARRVLPRLPDWRRELLDLADVVLPNSRAEGRQLQRLFGLDARRIQVVPNGVDPRFLNASPELFRERYGERDFVLYVGRIEPRKNVLNLIRSAKVAKVPLVLVGAPVPGHEAYCELCQQEGQGVATWLGRVDHEAPLLESAMAAARVFALPSWFETPGLAALEAASAGCSIVITPYGCAREYFGDRAHYARPGKASEITRALRSAWNSRPAPGFAEAIVRDFAWSRVAQATKEAYERIAP